MVGEDTLLFIFLERQLIYPIGHAWNDRLLMWITSTLFIIILSTIFCYCTTLKISINVICVGSVRQMTNESIILLHVKYSVYTVELTRHCFYKLFETSQHWRPFEYVFWLTITTGWQLNGLIKLQLKIFLFRFVTVETKIQFYLNQNIRFYYSYYKDENLTKSPGFCNNLFNLKIMKNSA